MLIKLLPKQFLFLTIALCAFQSFAKEKPKLEKPFRRVMIGVHFSPDVAFRVLTKRKNDLSTNYLIDYFKEQQIPKFGFCVGLNTFININSFSGIETGIWYMNMGVQRKWEQTQSGYYWNGNNYIQADSRVKQIDDFHYIGIPLKVNFTVGKGKVRFLAGIGLAVNFLAKSTVTFIIKSDAFATERRTIDSNNGYSGLNIMPLAEAGIDYKINNRMNLKVSPSFRFGVIDVIPSSEPIGAFLFNGGISVRYYFGI